MAERDVRLAVSAFPDGITYIVRIDQIDEQDHVITTRWLEGMPGNSEEDAVDRVIAQIVAQAN